MTNEIPDLAYKYDPEQRDLLEEFALNPGDRVWLVTMPDGKAYEVTLGERVSESERAERQRPTVRQWLRRLAECRRSRRQRQRHSSAYLPSQSDSGSPVVTCRLSDQEPSP